MCASWSVSWAHSSDCRLPEARRQRAELAGAPRSLGALATIPAAAQLTRRALRHRIRSSIDQPVGVGMVIREFRPEDCDALVEVLKANLQYADPETEGPEAMIRVHQCEAAVFLVAEEDGNAIGMIRAVYDGSKALIHIVSVHPAYQRRGVGTDLVRETARRLKKRGATNLAVTVPGDNLEFWKKLSFRMTTRIMFAHRIASVAG